MSGFCVFGVARTHCRKQAIEKTDTYDGKLKRQLTAEEYEARVAAMEEELWGRARPKQISPAFDAPQFARDWIAVGKQAGAIRAAKLMVRGAKIDKKGAPKLNKKGDQVIGWIPYGA